MEFYKNDELIIDVWGDFACFTRPEFKVERVSFDCITPSAARGILNAIYSKPIEFYYQITKIEIINPIKTITMKKNEFKEKTDAKKLEPMYNFTDGSAKGLTQRTTVYLRDVYYRIHAQIIKQPSFNGSLEQLYDQFERRVKKGKCFYQPCLGTRECLCYFSMPNYDKKPLNLDLDLNIMVYDIFDITKNTPIDTLINETSSFSPSFFAAKIENGVLEVPCFDDIKVLKVKEI